MASKMTKIRIKTIPDGSINIPNNNQKVIYNLTDSIGALSEQFFKLPDETSNENKSIILPDGKGNGSMLFFCNSCDASSEPSFIIKSVTSVTEQDFDVEVEGDPRFVSILNTNGVSQSPPRWCQEVKNNEVTIKISSDGAFMFPDLVAASSETPTETLVTPTETLVTPTETLVTPTETLVTPTETLVTPTETLVTPTETLVTPTETLVTPTETLVTPTETLVTPTETLVTPTETLVTPTETLVTPTETLVTPTETLVTPTETLVTPTETLVTPTETLVTPTETLVTPTETLVTPTETLVTPTETLVTPTETLVTPTETLVTPTDPAQLTTEEPLTAEQLILELEAEIALCNTNYDNLQAELLACKDREKDRETSEADQVEELEKLRDELDALKDFVLDEIIKYKEAKKYFEIELQAYKDREQDKEVVNINQSEELEKLGIELDALKSFSLEEIIKYKTEKNALLEVLIECKNTPLITTDPINQTESDYICALKNEIIILKNLLQIEKDECAGKYQEFLDTQAMGAKKRINKILDRIEDIKNQETN